MDKTITKDTQIETHERLACLETQSKYTNESVNSLLTNHLPHVQAALDKLNDKIDSLTYKMAFFGGGLALLSFMIGLAVRFIK